MLRVKEVLTLILLGLAVAACGAPAADSGAPEQLRDESTTGEVEATDASSGGQPASQNGPGEAGDASGNHAETAEASPAEAGDVAVASWQEIALTDVRTGGSFTLADFRGKTVVVDLMATWCPPCFGKLNSLRAARSELNSDEVVFIALSVETHLDNASLASYADGGGFDWTFAVVSKDMLAELVAAFGRTAANPPATPHFIIRADGTTTELSAGPKSAGQILEQIRAEQVRAEEPAAEQG